MNPNFPTVCFDPGHGGRDPGAVAPQGLRESDVVLAVCLRAKQMLEPYALNVLMTRGDDTFVPLSKRSAFANAHDADIFISVHCNSARHPAEGIETFSTGSEKGAALAEVVQDAMIELFPNATDRGTKVAKWMVLRKTRMPAALAELGFIHTPEGEAHFRQDEVITLCAEALVHAVLEYFGILPMKAEVVKIVPHVGGGYTKVPVTSNHIEELEIARRKMWRVAVIDKIEAEADELEKAAKRLRQQVKHLKEEYLR